MKRFFGAALALLLPSLAHAQGQPVQWRYSFDPPGQALATYPGNITAYVPANGGTAGRSLSDWFSDTVNVKGPAFGAKGDGVTLYDGACSASSAAFSSASATFTQADVGKTIVVHGAGIAGAPVQTTITTVPDAHDLTLANACTNTVANATYQYATDDTAAVSAAISYAQTNNKQVWFPAGNYALVTQTASLPASSVTLRGDGLPSAQNGYNFASQLWIFNQAASAFDLGNGFNWLHLGVFYPLQDGAANATFTGSVSGSTLTASNVAGTIAVGQTLMGSGIASGITIVSGSGSSWTLSRSPGTISSESMATYVPIAYPATFHADSTNPPSNVNFEGYNFINPYDLFTVDATSQASGAGRITFGQGMGYCLHSCFYLTEGLADVVVVTRGSYWSVGADASLNGGNQYAPQWTAANGEFLHVDVGSATKNSVDGFTLAANIVHGYRYLARVLSGTLTAAIIPTYSDGVQTVLSVEGTGVFDGPISIPGWVYSRNPYDTSVTSPVINLACTSGAVVLDITGTYFKNALGNIVDNGSAASCIQTLTETGNTFHAWGQSTTSGSYYANVLGGGAAIKYASITGNVFQAVSSGSFLAGVALEHANGNTIVANNVFQGPMNYAVWDSANDNGVFLLASNTSNGIITSAMRVTGTHSPISSANVWDKPSLATIASGFGTSPGAIAGTAWYAGRLTVGTGGATTGTINWPWTMASAPICAANDETSANPIRIAPTTTNAVLTGTMAAGDSITFQCQAN